MDDTAGLRTRLALPAPASPDPPPKKKRHLRLVRPPPLPNPKVQAEIARLEEEIATYERPRTRADCEVGGSNELRPCPWASCRYHLYVDIRGEEGQYLKVNFPSEEDPLLKTLLTMPATCALDVAAEGPHTLEETGGHLGITRERLRQIEKEGIQHLWKHPLVKEAGEAAGLDTSRMPEGIPDEEEETGVRPILEDEDDERDEAL